MYVEGGMCFTRSSLLSPFSALSTVGKGRFRKLSITISQFSTLPKHKQDKVEKDKVPLMLSVKNYTIHALFVQRFFLSA